MPKPDNWIIAKWQRNGFPVFIRMAAAYRGKGQVPGYSHKIVVVIELRNPEPSGLPRFRIRRLEGSRSGDLQPA